MPVDALGSLYAGGVSAHVLRDVGKDRRAPGRCGRPSRGDVPDLDPTVVLDLVLIPL